MVVEAAINDRAAALVTYNMAHFRSVPVRFSVRLACPVKILREAIEP